MPNLYPRSRRLNPTEPWIFLASVIESSHKRIISLFVNLLTPKKYDNKKRVGSQLFLGASLNSSLSWSDRQNIETLARLKKFCWRFPHTLMLRFEFIV